MSQKAVRILGIDPGLNHTGYGLVDFVPGHFTYVASGVLNVPAGELSDRLGFIFKSLSALIEEHHPNVASIEKTFLNTNAQSSMLLSHARGAAMCAVACHSILCKEISTREIKKSVTGYGAADSLRTRASVRTSRMLWQPRSATAAPVSCSASYRHSEPRPAAAEPVYPAEAQVLAAQETSGRNVMKERSN